LLISILRQSDLTFVMPISPYKEVSTYVHKKWFSKGSAWFRVSKNKWCRKWLNKWSCSFEWSFERWRERLPSKRNVETTCMSRSPHLRLMWATLWALCATLCVASLYARRQIIENNACAAQLWSPMQRQQESTVRNTSRMQVQCK